MPMSCRADADRDGVPMLRTSLEIAVPADDAWQLLIETAAWPRWGPSVRAVESPARFIDRGTRGRVQTALGLWLPFEITQWRTGRQWTWRVAGIPATGHVVDALGPRRCRVTFTVPSWAPLYLPACRVALRRLRGMAVDRANAHPAGHRPGGNTPRVDRRT
jgi:hypothetical protein